MFPIRDHNPSTRTPIITYALIALNIGVFLATYAFLQPTAQGAAFFSTWGMVPRDVASGHNLVSLGSAMFLHGGWMHLLGNMLFLWIFGDNLEDELGHIGYLGYYLACGVGAGLAQVWADPASPIPTVGASGAIAGILGGYLLLFPKARVDVLFIFVVFFRIFPVSAWLVLLIWFALQLFYGTAANAAQDGVAYWEHIGGFVIGMALMVPSWLGRGGTGFWSRNQGTPPHPEATYAKSSIPVIKRR